MYDSDIFYSILYYFFVYDLEVLTEFKSTLVYKWNSIFCSMKALYERILLSLSLYVQKIVKFGTAQLYKMVFRLVHLSNKRFIFLCSTSKISSLATKFHCI